MRPPSWTARTDPVLLERVLANLIDNALRHTPASIRCALQVHRADGALELRVIDHGPGIPAEQRRLALEPFQRLGDAGGGVGLGLAVARGLADAMSAQLLLNATPDGGLTTVLRLKAYR